jgi:hypothetical protein
MSFLRHLGSNIPHEVNIHFQAILRITQVATQRLISVATESPWVLVSSIFLFCLANVSLMIRSWNNADVYDSISCMLFTPQHSIHLRNILDHLLLNSQRGYLSITPTEGTDTFGFGSVMRYTVSTPECQLLAARFSLPFTRRSTLTLLTNLRDHSQNLPRLVINLFSGRVSLHLQHKSQRPQSKTIWDLAQGLA